MRAFLRVGSRRGSVTDSISMYFSFFFLEQKLIRVFFNNKKHWGIQRGNQSGWEQKPLYCTRHDKNEGFVDALVYNVFVYVCIYFKKLLREINYS